MIIADETTLVISRVFDASPEEVFDAWLTREQWQAWIGPEGINCKVPLLEPHVGGKYHIDMQMSDGARVPVSGRFITIDRPRTLSFSWGWDGDPSRQSVVTLTFRDDHGKTELTLRQEGLGSIANRDDHGRGWNSALNKLHRFLQKGRP